MFKIDGGDGGDIILVGGEAKGESINDNGGSVSIRGGTFVVVVFVHLILNQQTILVLTTILCDHYSYLEFRHIIQRIWRIIRSHFRPV